jgi:HD-GYP domain-containing protein (c-di-GMP phosphodiesterase class II)
MVGSKMPAVVDEWTEVLAALSLATDLANGHDYEKTLRTCVLAVGLAEVAGFTEVEQRDVFHATLLRFIGCTSFAHEEALMFGDDIATRHAFATVDFGDLGQLWRAGGEALRGAPALGRLVRRGVALTRASDNLQRLFASQCEVATRLGTRLGLGAGVVRALGEIHERWDGEGGPAGLAGEQLGAVVRVVQVANLAELIHHRFGADAAIEVVGRRRGGALGPELADTFCTHARSLLAPLDSGSAWDTFVTTGARFPTIGPGHEVDEIVAAFADVADMVSGYTLGHSRAVAKAAGIGAANLGLSAERRAELQRAALLHDVGRVAVPASIWDKRGSLSPADWERIRLHAYYGDRILRRAPKLRGAAALVCLTHERCDGSGYPRAVDAKALAPEGHLLAAADVYCALREERPHRPARSRAEATSELRREVAAGRLHAEAVDALLGSRVASERNSPRPAGLTPREIEVLQWVARGETNKEVANRLGISPRTVGHHLAHAFEKIGVSTRAAAGLFAVEHGLLGPELGG